MEVFAELGINIPIQLHLLSPCQQFIQLIEAQLPLKGAEVDVIAENCKLQTCVDRILRRLHPIPDLIQPGQNEAVGICLFLLEPVFLDAIMGFQKIGNLRIQDREGLVRRDTLVKAMA